MIGYRTLGVRIEALYGDRYRAIVRGIGDGHAEFELTFDDNELDALADVVSRPRSRRRRIETDGSARARAFGQQLFDMVFNDSARDVLRDSLSQARNEDHGLRIMLQVDGAGRLRNVPWELLWNAPGFVSMSAYTPIVRYAKAPALPQPLGLSPPLRILGMVSSPSDMPALDADREREQLAEGCRALIDRGLLQIDWVEEATLGGLLNCLNEGDYHIFHFIGHGDFDEQAEDGVLLLEGRAGKSHRLTGADLGAILADQHKLRLAVINACEGARVSMDSSGVAASLIQYALPAVIAMQFEISDEAAISFAKHFYGSIARGHPIDKALMDARRGMFADEQGLEWATPVLFTSVDDGRLFEVGLDAADLDGPVPRPLSKDESSDEPEVAPKQRSESATEPDLAPKQRSKPATEPQPEVQLQPEPTPEPTVGIDPRPVGALQEHDRDRGVGGIMRPRTVAVLGVALVPILIVALVVAGVFSGGSGLKYGEPIRVGEVPVGVALANDRVWVPGQQSEEVTSIDPHTGAPDEPIPIGGKPNSIAVDLQTGYIWVVSIDNGLVTVLDPGHGSREARTVNRFTLEGKPNAVVLGFGKAWVTGSEDGTVSEIDERSAIEGGKPEIKRIEGVGDRLSGIAMGKHYVWVASAGDPGVIRMTPHDGGYISIPVKYGISGIAVQEGKTEEEVVWISNLRDQSVSRIVPNEESGEVTGSPIYVGREPKGIAATPEGIWVASSGSGKVSWIAVTPSGDRKQDQDRSIPLAGQPNAIAVGLNAVWVTNLQTSSVTPLEP